MHPRTHIIAIGDAASIPECPSCCRRCICDVGCVGFKEVEFSERIVTFGTAEEGEEHE